MPSIKLLREYLHEPRTKSEICDFMSCSKTKYEAIMYEIREDVRIFRVGNTRMFVLKNAPVKRNIDLTLIYEEMKKPCIIEPELTVGCVKMF